MNEEEKKEQLFSDGLRAYEEKDFFEAHELWEKNVVRILSGGQNLNPGVNSAGCKFCAFRQWQPKWRQEFAE
ncbi:MAG: hypothetical protein CM1200mP10_09370 [Candidatus Neomarinimicrobiota bacterium]|nr:MAG: hypothetical protein CM1200mP10_09370 [Candidatus Neomarinimicrobiota bacterium]